VLADRNGPAAGPRQQHESRRACRPGVSMRFTRLMRQVVPTGLRRFSTDPDYPLAVEPRPALASSPT
jgi:hypothetical protein